MRLQVWLLIFPAAFGELLLRCRNVPAGFLGLSLTRKLGPKVVVNLAAMGTRERPAFTGQEFHYLSPLLAQVFRV